MRRNSARAGSKGSSQANTYPVELMAPPSVEKLATYFRCLGRGETLQNIDFFKRNVELIGQKNQSPLTMLEHFWQASRAASRIPQVNKSATIRITKDANSYLSRQVHKLDAVMQDKSLSVEHLERLLNIYSRLQTVPPPSTVQALKDETFKKMDEAKADCLVKLLVQFIEVGVYPGDEWMEKWWTVARPKSGEWGLEGGFPVFYHLAQLDLLRNEDPTVDKEKLSPCAQISQIFANFFNHKIDSVFPKERGSDFSKNVDSRVFFAGKWFGCDFIKKCKIEQSSRPISRSEEAFGRLFLDTEMSIKSNGILVPEIDRHIDFELTHNKTTFGLEYDGALHFNRELKDDSGDVTLAFNTSTRLQSWLIKELCPELRVLRVPYFQCYQDDRRQPWEGTFSALSAEKPGVYAYHGDGVVKNMAEPENNIFKGHDL